MNVLRSLSISISIIPLLPWLLSPSSLLFQYNLVSKTFGDFIIRLDITKFNSPINIRGLIGDYFIDFLMVLLCYSLNITIRPFKDRLCFSFVITSLSCFFYIVHIFCLRFHRLYLDIIVINVIYIYLIYEVVFPFLTGYLKNLLVW